MTESVSYIVWEILALGMVPFRYAHIAPVGADPGNLYPVEPIEGEPEFLLFGDFEKKHRVRRLARDIDHLIEQLVSVYEPKDGEPKLSPAEVEAYIRASKYDGGVNYVMEFNKINKVSFWVAIVKDCQGPDQCPCTNTEEVAV